LFKLKYVDFLQKIKLALLPCFTALYLVLLTVLLIILLYMTSITANELKTKGVSILDKETGGDSEVMISVRGRNKYVVVPIEKYNYLRECELETALLESKRDLKQKKFVKESVEKHIKRITADSRHG
jgi:prevent-host-death family protein